MLCRTESSEGLEDPVRKVREERCVSLPRIMLLIVNAVYTIG